MKVNKYTYVHTYKYLNRRKDKYLSISVVGCIHEFICMYTILKYKWIKNYLKPRQNVMQYIHFRNLEIMIGFGPNRWILTQITKISKEVEVYWDANEKYWGHIVNGAFETELPHISGTTETPNLCYIIYESYVSTKCCGHHKTSWELISIPANSPGWLKGRQSNPVQYLWQNFVSITFLLLEFLINL